MGKGQCNNVIAHRKLGFLDHFMLFMDIPPPIMCMHGGSHFKYVTQPNNYKVTSLRKYSIRQLNLARERERERERERITTSKFGPILIPTPKGN